MPGRMLERQRLLDRMKKAEESDNRKEADLALQAANRWLRRYPNDAPVLNAQRKLRETFPVDPEDVV
jgi:hypothetical protein